MTQTTVVRASALGHLAGFSGTESQRCSTPYGSTLNTIDFSKSTRLKSNSKQHRIDSKNRCDANFKPLSGGSQRAQSSQRYQTTWNGKHREIGPDFGPPDGLILYSSRRVVKSPAFGANVVNSLNETARKSNNARGPAPTRFSNGTRSFGGCSPVDEDEFTLSLTSFNILAPIYYRKWEGKRESEEREAWWERNKKIVDMLEEKHSSIICLQEFWLGNPELCALYTSHLHKMGYETFQLARTNNRGDGLLTAIDSSKLRVLDQQDIEFRDCGDRVAQLLRVQCKHLTRGGDHPSEATGDCIVGTEPSCPMEFLLVNTHLLFPHNSNSTLIRLRQVCKILEHLERYKAEQKLPPMPIVLCGDWNGSKRGQVYKFMRSQGFSSSFDTARNFEDETLQQWISHRNHRGNLCGVDFIWLLNPSGQMAPLTADWKAAVFGMIKAKLTKAGLRERDAFHFFQAGSEAREQDVVTLEDFILAMDQLGLTGEDSVGLTKEEVGELLASADADGNGVLDYDEFKSILKTRSMAETYELIKRATGIVEDPATDPPPSPTADVPVHAALFGELPSPRRPAIPLQYMYTSAAETLKPCGQSAPGGEQRLPHLDLVVRDAFLEPEEMEHGTWPDDWNLSDHAPVTSIFAPVLRRPLEQVR